MMEAQDVGELLLPSVAARELGVSAATIRNWIAQDKLPALRTSGGYRLIRREDLDRLKAARGADRGPEAA